MKDQQSGCIAVIGSVTQAMRAQKELANQAIPTNLVKTSGSGFRGCSYALSYSCSQDANVEMILARAKIRVRETER